MSYADLPEHILIDIFKQCEERSLRQLTRVNKRFRQLIIQRLPAGSVEVSFWGDGTGPNGVSYRSAVSK